VLLNASQLTRIKDANLNLTVSVDKVAASGGYMMACVADKIIAAPFAILGSIGVLAQLPNFNRLLDKNGDKEREKLKIDLQETHVLFRNFVSEHRSKLDIEKVATGEHWYGQQAIDLNLVDELKTSDEILIDALEVFDIYQISTEVKQDIKEKLFGGLFASVNAILNRLTGAQNDSKYH